MFRSSWDLRFRGHDFCPNPMTGPFPAISRRFRSHSVRLQRFTFFWCMPIVGISNVAGEVEPRSGNFVKNTKNRQNLKVWVWTGTLSRLLDKYPQLPATVFWFENSLCSLASYLEIRLELLGLPFFWWRNGNLMPFSLGVAAILDLILWGFLSMFRWTILNQSWLVVWNIFFHSVGNDHPNWTNSYFSEG